MKNDLVCSTRDPHVANVQIPPRADLSTTNKTFEMFQKIGTDSRLSVAVLQRFSILGDTNSCPRKSSVISELCDTYGLQNLIDKPTCFKGTTPNLIVCYQGETIRSHCPKMCTCNHAVTRDSFATNLSIWIDNICLFIINFVSSW